jgi:hypothetical protein
MELERFTTGLQESDARARRRAPWGDQWPVEVFVALAVACAVLVVCPLNTDSGWYLTGARRVLEGERLYVDLVDVNPPLVFWLLTPAALVADTFAVPDSVVIGGFEAALLSVSTIGSLLVLGAPRPAPRLLRSSLLIGFALTVTLLSVRQVAQRDGLAAIALLPYCFLSWRAATERDTPAWLAVSCGLVAGLGVALKPFFVLPWLAIASVGILWRRDIKLVTRLEVLTVAVVQCAYAAIVLLATPEYLSNIVPLARSTYDAYGGPWYSLIPTTRFAAIALCGSIAVVLPLAFRRTSSPAPMLGAAALGFLGSYVLQSKGFSYHLIPAQVFATVAVIAVAHELLYAAALVRAGSRLRLAVVTLFVVGAVGAGWRVLPAAIGTARDARRAIVERYPAPVIAIAARVAEIAAGEPIYVLSTSVFPAFPLVNLGGAKWPYHYNCLWPIPAFYAGVDGRPYRRPTEQPAAERVFFDTVVADVIRTPPRLLVVDRREKMQAMRGRSFDYVAYFSGSPDFAALFKRYRYIGRIGEWDLYHRLS